MTTETACHQILDYLRGCIEAEYAASQYRGLELREVLLLESGSAPLGDTSITLPATARARTWAQARESAGSGQVIFAGWPLVRGRRSENGKNSEVAAALLFTEVALTRTGAGGFRLAPTSRSIDLDEAALELLGCPADDRERLLRDYALAIRPAAESALAQAIQFLRREGLITDDCDPTSLAAVDEASGTSNTAIVWVGDADRSRLYRLLVEDFDALRNKSASELTVGPLGVLCRQTRTAEGPLHPTPAVLATTLEQERAICSAMNSSLTVVTGPPGTGKSQVLANTVAAALAEGQSVLLASKNNHAIDVVRKRIVSMHEDSVPIRAGNWSFRVKAAQRMGAALSKDRPNPSGLAAAVQEWQRIRSLVERPYQQIAERFELESQIESTRNAVEASRQALPAGVTADPRSVDADLLAASIGKARRRFHEYEGVPSRWFWQRWRKRAAERELDEAMLAVSLLLGDGAQEAARRAMADGPQAVLALATKVVELLTGLDKLHRLETALSLLPDRSEADRAISASFATRHPAASKLFGAIWRERFRPRAPGRGNARQYQAGLAARAESGSGIGPLRSQLPGVLDVFPVWAVTSLAAGGWFPLIAGLFDLVIIDEASQSDIASAVPLLYRAKRAMVVGDPNQLTHITSMGASADAHLAKKHGLTEVEHSRYSYRNTSLYGLAASRSGAEPIFLNRHFRSHPDVIGFSNEVFYGNRLQVETRTDRFLPGLAFQWRDVPGQYQPGPDGHSAQNTIEAEAVIDVLGEILDELAGTDKTVGIVTPFTAQRKLLQELKGARELKDDRYRQQVTIDTAHGFQGDERDVMIFSPTVARGAPKGLVRFVANPNLLNVALTRARARTIVVGDQAFARGSESLLSKLVSYAERIENRET